MRKGAALISKVAPRAWTERKVVLSERTPFWIKTSVCTKLTTVFECICCIEIIGSAPRQPQVGKHRLPSAELKLHFKLRLSASLRA